MCIRDRILAATMTVSLLASCGGSGSTSGSASQPEGSGASASASQTSDLKVGVFYYNFADAYITPCLLYTSRCV